VQNNVIILSIERAAVLAAHRFENERDQIAPRILATVVSFARLDSLAANLFAPTSGMGSIRGDTQYRDLAIKQLTDLTIRSPSESPLAQSGQ